MRISLLSFVSGACVALLSTDTSRAQLESQFQFELSADKAAEVLSLPEAQLKSMIEGKERLSEESFDGFRTQFGLLVNGLPTFQFGPNEYFVLLPLSELDKEGAFNRDENQAEGQSLKQSQNDSNASNCTNGVDHRTLLPPIRNQGHRGTCVAFASCADLEAKLFGMNPAIDLSENLAYYFYMQFEGSSPCDDPGLATFRAAGYLKARCVGDEAIWPYVDTDPNVLKTAGNCAVIDAPPPAFHQTPGVRIDDYVHLPKGTEVTPDGSIDIRDTQTLEEYLCNGENIVFGTVVAWKASQEEGIIDVTLGPAGQPIFGMGGHAMLIVGYDKTGAKPYFIVRNSWGTSHGHAGYYFFTYDYIRTYAKYGYVTSAIAPGMVQLP